MSVLVFLLLQASAWFAWSVAMHASVPGDNVEQLNWAHAFEFGYFKHPPLATWVLYPLQQAIGAKAWLTVLLGEASVTLALWITWRVMCRVAARDTAFVALAVGACVTYFSSRGHLYNHNTAMLPPLALALGAAVALLQGAGRRRDWVLLGLATGAGMMVKYQMALFSAAYVLVLIGYGAVRHPREWRGLAIAVAIALLALVPHLVWLVVNDFPPLRYAAGNLGAALGAASRLAVTASFMVQQLGRAWPAMCVLGLLAGANALARRRRPFVAAAAAAAVGGAVARTGPGVAVPPVRGLAWLCLAPTVLTLAFGLVAGSHLQNHWGTGLLLSALPLLAVWLARHPALVRGEAGSDAGGNAAAVASRPGLRARLRRWPVNPALLPAVVFVQAAVALTQLLPPTGSSSGVANDYTAYPAAALGREALDTWRRRNPVGEPALIVAPGFEGGLASLAFAVPPPVLADAEPPHAPWIPRALADACGALLVEPVTPDGRGSLPPLPWGMGERIVLRRDVALQRRWRAGAAPIRVSIGVIAPLGAGRASECRGYTTTDRSRSPG
ncbi:MAG: glycosyltransferase family 39 protein [Lautropia sp.]